MKYIIALFGIAGLTVLYVLNMVGPIKDMNRRGDKIWEKMEACWNRARR